MGSGDLFKRRTLLPRTARTSAPARSDTKEHQTPSASPAYLDSHDEDWDESTDAGVFDRETVVPEISADQLARQAMDEADAKEASEIPLESLPPFSGQELDVDISAAALELSTKADNGSGASAELSLSEPALALDFDNQSALDFVDQHDRTTVTDLTDVVGAELQEVGSPSDPAQAGLPLDPGEPDPNDDSERPKHTSLSDLFALGDFSGALDEAERRLARDGDNELAAKYARKCREVLLGMYQARLGDLDQRVTLLVAHDQIRWLSIDHRAGFLISLMEQPTTLDEVMDLCGMDRLDAMKVLIDLLDKEIIQLES